MDYKDYYAPSLCEGMPQMVVEHLLGKYEAKPGILVIEREGIPQYYPVDTKEVLQKSIEYFNNMKGHSAKWFYIKDLQKYALPQS